MNPLSVIIAQLFRAYGKEADELSLRTYLSVLKQYDQDLIEKTVKQAVNGAFERLPTVTQLVKLARHIAQEQNEQGRRNLIEHANRTSDYVKHAVEAGWSLPQRDELIDVCDRAINLRTGEWRWSQNEWAKQVAALVEKVNQYREACIQARSNKTSLPDETQQDWAWAIPKPDEDDWDPAKESLWDYVKRNFRGNNHESFRQD